MSDFISKTSFNRKQDRIKVYISDPVTEPSPDNKPVVEAIRRTVVFKGYIARVASDHTYTSTNQWESESNLFLEEQKALGDSELLIAYLPNSCTGVGITIGLAQCLHMPLIIIGDNISRMAIQGLNKAYIINVNNQDILKIEKKLDRLLDSIQDTIIKERFRKRPLCKIVGQRVRELRIERGWSEAETAKRLGFNLDSYRYLESGLITIISANHILRIASVLDVPTQDILKIAEFGFDTIPDGNIIHEVAYDDVPEYRAVMEFVKDVELRGRNGPLYNKSIKLTADEIRKSLRTYMKSRGFDYPDV